MCEFGLFVVLMVLFLLVCLFDDLFSVVGSLGIGVIIDLINGSSSLGEVVDEMGEVFEFDVYGFVNGCWLLWLGEIWFVVLGDVVYDFGVVDVGSVVCLFMKLFELGIYLFYDQDGGYVVFEDGLLIWQISFQLDVIIIDLKILFIDDDFIFGVEWIFEILVVDFMQYQL